VSAAVVNVATHLAGLAAREPDRAAIIHPAGRGEYQRISFRELHEESDRLAAGLEAVGVRRGVRAALMVPPGPDFFALTFALFKVGAVPVLIDPGMGVRNLGKCLAEAALEAFIGVPKAHLARKLLGWARATVKITVTTGALFARYTVKELRQLSVSHLPFPQAATTAEEIAAILFTSGSTGVAKGVVYTHGMFAAQIEMLQRTYGIEPGEIDLSTFPLFALFGPALGMTAVVPEMNPTRPANVDPRKIIGAIERFGVTNLFGSPALLDRVGRFGAANGTRLPTLRRVISAGAPVPAKVVERFTALLPPGVEVFTPYGATETLPVASVGSDEILRETRALTERGCGVCVGRPVAPVRIRVLPVTDQPIPTLDESLCLGEGEIGEITVTGPVVTRTYFNRPEATKLAKVTDPATGEVWHRMGDVGYIDSAGRLWFCGRKSQRVVTKSGTLFTIPTEAVFNTHPDVYRTALVGVADGGEVRPVLCVELEKTSRRPWPEIEKGLQALAERFPHARSVAAYLRHPAFPVDVRHNAKIFREKLAHWAARQLRRYRWPVPVPVVPPPTAAAQPVPA
jgi:acyl-CoA synthetase (AMP-forming)/AMP-acid ligase II